MLTQCPHCLTLFRVGPDHLKAAAGQVRCCRCHKVFNALMSLREAPTPFGSQGPSAPDTETGMPPPEREARDGIPTETASESPGHDTGQGASPPPSHEAFEPLLPDFDPEDDPQAALIDDILEQDDGLDPEPDYFAGGSESQMSELLDQDSSSLLLPDTAPPTEEPQNGFGNIVALHPPTDTETSGTTPDEALPEEIPDLEESILTDEAIDEELGKPDYDSVPAFRAEPELPAGTSPIFQLTTWLLTTPPALAETKLESVGR